MISAFLGIRCFSAIPMGIAARRNLIGGCK
jgi:hypothetical protein